MIPSELETLLPSHPHPLKLESENNDHIILRKLISHFRKQYCFPSSREISQEKLEGRDNKEEKGLRHVAMVAKSLDFNKPVVLLIQLKPACKNLAV